MASGKWAGSDRRVRLPKEWHAQRQRVLRDGGRICHVCGLPGADQVDHIRPGDDHSDANLAPIHKEPCHREKSSREGGQALGRVRKQIAASRKRPAERHPGEL